MYTGVSNQRNAPQFAPFSFSTWIPQFYFICFILAFSIFDHILCTEFYNVHENNGNKHKSMLTNLQKACVWRRCTQKILLDDIWATL